MCMNVYVSLLLLMTHSHRRHDQGRMMTENIYTGEGKDKSEEMAEMMMIMMITTLDDGGDSTLSTKSISGCVVWCSIVLFSISPYPLAFLVPFLLPFCGCLSLQKDWNACHAI